MERRNVAGVTAEAVNAIKNKTAYALPNSPSALGMKPDEIKEAFFRAITDDNESVIAEIVRILNELDEVLISVWRYNDDHGKRISKSVVGVEYNAATGVLSFAHDDGTSEEIDLPLELIVKSGEYDELNDRIVLTLANGNKINIDASKLLGEFIGDGESIEKTRIGNKYSFRLVPELLGIIKREDGARLALESHESSDDVHGIAGQILRTVYEHNAREDSHPALSYRLTALESANEVVSNLLGVKYEYKTDADVKEVKEPPENVLPKALLSEVHAGSIVEDVLVDKTSKKTGQLVFENKVARAITTHIEIKEKYTADGIVYSASPGGEALPRLDIKITSDGYKEITSNGDGPFMYLTHKYSKPFSEMGTVSLLISFKEISAKTSFRICASDGSGKYFLPFLTDANGRVLIFNKYPVELEDGYKLRLVINHDMSVIRVYNLNWPSFYKDFYADLSSAHSSFSAWKSVMTRTDCLIQWRFGSAGVIAFDDLRIYDGDVFFVEPRLKLIYPTAIESGEKILVFSERVRELCRKYSGLADVSSYLDLVNRRFVIKTRVRDALASDKSADGVMLTDGIKTVVAVNSGEYVDLSDELPSDSHVWGMPSYVEFLAEKEYEDETGNAVTEKGAVRSVITYQVERKV